MNAPGYNPIRWRCDSDGCFNVMKRPKIEVFAECFPGRIAMSDIDGIVERHGMALLMEWKPAPIALQAGQKIMYENLSKDGKVTVLVLAGDAQTMNVTHRQWFRLDRKSDWKESNLDEAKQFCRAWSKWVDEIVAWKKEYSTAESRYWPERV